MMTAARFEGEGTVSLDELPTDPPGKLSKEEGQGRFEALNDELFELQDLAWGAKIHSVLLVLQGRDAAGKDGAVKHVVGALNPRGVRITSFGVPTEEERQHDFLWRVHRKAPRAGEFGIFNRSHYEDVLVVRVQELAPKPVWKDRYQLINAFERTLISGNTIVLKYFLHISKKEQEKRLLAREASRSAAWKLNVNDWRDREQWSAYSAAYEEAIERCASRDAPWIVVPSDAKWYRNLVVAETLAQALRPHRKEWEKKLEQEGKVGRRDLAEWRKEHGVKINRR